MFHACMTCLLRISCQGADTQVWKVHVHVWWASWVPTFYICEYFSHLAVNKEIGSYTPDFITISTHEKQKQHREAPHQYFSSCLMFYSWWIQNLCFLTVGMFHNILNMQHLCLKNIDEYFLTFISFSISYVHIHKNISIHAYRHICCKSMWSNMLTYMFMLLLL
jgi:hypothetical protein